MTLKKVLARDWNLEILVDAAYVEVLGLTSFGFGNSKTDADTKTFDTDGWDEHIVAGRGRSLSCDAKYLEDPADGSRDPGQAAVEAAALLIGHDSTATFRLTSPGGVTKVFSGSVNMKDVGGGVNDSTSWGCDILVSGTVTATNSNNLSALSGIEENTGAALTLVPAFAAGTYEYACTVNAASDWVKFTPTAALGVITVDGAIVTTETQSGEVPLVNGINEINIVVKETGKNAVTYVIRVALPAD